MIGKGSFAKVYLATKKETNTEYAIKAFNKEFMLEQFKVTNEILVAGQGEFGERDKSHETVQIGELGPPI
jgi:serine/threonine protein kinase